MRFPQVSDKVQEAPANALRSVFARIGQVLLITDRMKKKSGESETATAEAPEAATGGESGPAATETAPATAAPATSAEAGTSAETAAAGDVVAAGGAVEAAGASAAPAAAPAPASAPAQASAAAPAATEAPARKPSARKPAARKPAAKAPAADKPAAKAPAAKKPAGSTTGNVRVLPEDEAKTTPVTARKPRPRKPTAAGTTTAAPAPATASAPASAPAPAATPAPAAASAPAAAPAEPEVVAAPEGPVSTGAAPLPNYDQLTIASLRARLRNLSLDQVKALITYEQGHENRADVIAMFERRATKLENPES